MSEVAIEAQEGMDTATYEQLAQIELEFEDLDTEIMGKQYLLTLPTYQKRTAVLSKIQNFWPLVLEQSPPEIDNFIQPSDSAVFMSALQSIEVERFEIPASATPASSGKQLGEPRSLLFRFHFGENDWFEDRVLEKKFWFRRSTDGWTGRVSEPVRINWKADKDLTNGLLNAACDLHEAHKAAGVLNMPGGLSDKERQAKYTAVQGYADLVKRVEESAEGALSFFAWFGFRGRFVSEEEHKTATEKYDAEQAKIRSGEAPPESLKKDEDDEEGNDLDDPDEADADIFPAGEDLALALAEDVWPSAIKYFTEAQEADDMDSIDFDDEMDEDEDEEVLDIRGLVRGRGARESGGGSKPPSKKQKV